MSTVPPTYSFPGVYYNPVFFPSISGFLTLSQANTLYLARSGIATSVAFSTLFQGAVTISGLVTLTGGLLLTGGLTVDTLTVNTLTTLNNILTINATSSIIGQLTFTLLPILPAGYEFLTTGSQTITGIKTFSSPIVSSGASITANTILASSLVNNSITQNQIASPYTLLNSGSTQTILGDKILNGMITTNDMIINIFSPVAPYTGTIGFIPACTLNYLNLTISQYDSMMYIGQSIGSGPNQPYGFCICDYNSGLTGIRISGNGSANNCNVVVSGTQTIQDLLTLNNGLLINTGNIDIPQTIYAGTIACDFYINRLNNDIFFESHNFTTYSVTSGNSSILPTAGIAYGGLSIGYNCSNSVGETDFINLANYSLTGGFNFYTMNAFTVPSLIATLNTSGLTLNGSITNNKIINSSATVPYTLICGTIPYPVGISGETGLQIGWNASGGTGESNFINLAQGGIGGFKFSTINAFLTNRVLASINLKANDGLYLTSTCGQLKIDDFNGGSYSTVLNQTGSTCYLASNGISTNLGLVVGDATGSFVTPISINSNFVYTNVPLTPQSLTAFNISHPTTTLPLPTTTNQYATVGYVNAQNLLPLNNTWTGTNYFYNSTRLINIGSAMAPVSVGSGSGNVFNLILGEQTSLSTVSTSGGNIAISTLGASSMSLTTGSNNHCIGGGCLTSLVSGSNNLVFGSGSGTSLISGSNNVIIGAGTWQTTGSAFNNCTVLGVSAIPTASNQVVLGTVNESVVIKGGLDSNGISNAGSIQLTGQIIQNISNFTAGTGNTLTTLPRFLTFTPAAGMGFVVPAPSVSNAGQIFTWRKIAAGGGQTINFSCVGGLAIWQITNSVNLSTSISISTIMQFTWLSTGTIYTQI